MTTVETSPSDAIAKTEFGRKYSCCFSFENLYSAAFGKPISDSIRTSLRNVTQQEKNGIVKLWVARTNGRFECEDRLGTDGIVYTAFWDTAADQK